LGLPRLGPLDHRDLALVPEAKDDLLLHNVRVKLLLAIFTFLLKQCNVFMIFINSFLNNLILFLVLCRFLLRRVHQISGIKRVLSRVDKENGIVGANLRLRIELVAKKLFVDERSEKRRRGKNSFVTIQTGSSLSHLGHGQREERRPLLPRSASDEDHREPDEVDTGDDQLHLDVEEVIGDVVDEAVADHFADTEANRPNHHPLEHAVFHRKRRTHDVLIASHLVEVLIDAVHVDPEVPTVGEPE